MKLKPYTEYKDSGVELLGEIPEHWKIMKIKRLAKIIDGDRGKEYPGPEDLLDDGIVFLSSNNIVSDKFDFRKARFISVDKFNRLGQGKLVEGDLAITVRGTIGSVALFSDLGFETAFINAQMMILRPGTRLIPEYVYRVATSNYWKTELAIRAYGSAQQQLSNEILSSIVVPAPATQEQRQIVRFLDVKTRLIDRFIRNKGRLIKLLQEQKQAVINDCVTGKMEVRRIVDEDDNSSFRLQPSSCKMRDSGIDWLGEIPEHWEVLRIRHLATKTGSGKTPRGGAVVYVDEGIMLIRSQNVYDDGLRLDDVVYIDEEIDREMSQTRLQANDILLNITGASIGRSNIVPKSILPANVNQHVCIIRLRKNMNSRFISYFLKTQPIKYQILSLQQGASREGLNFQQVDNLLIILPVSMKEQEQIVNYIDQETPKIDQLLDQAQRQIDLIQEYRTRLIADVVTGKVDVRGILVEDAAEDEALEELVDEIDEGLPDDDEYETEA